MATHQRRVYKGSDGQVPAHEPDWSTRNDHDPGVTLLTLFGFLGAGLLGLGLGAAGAAWLLRQRRRRRRPRVRELSSTAAI